MLHKLPENHVLANFVIFDWEVILEKKLGIKSRGELIWADE